MGSRKIWFQNSRSAHFFLVVAFDAVLWSSRTPCNENGRFSTRKNDEGMEFVQFTEGPTKTRQGGLQSKNKDFQPSMFSVGGERCPVALFKQFVERRPLNMQWSVPFYLSIKRNRRLNDNIWFKTQPMGENTISNMMKTIVAGILALKKVTKSSQITVLERQQSAS